MAVNCCRAPLPTIHPTWHVRCTWVANSVIWTQVVCSSSPQEKQRYNQNLEWLLKGAYFKGKIAT